MLAHYAHLLSFCKTVGSVDHCSLIRLFFLFGASRLLVGFWTHRQARVQEGREEAERLLENCASLWVCD